jgi:hypothetical protein
MSTLKVTNIKAADGADALTIANGTGKVTFPSDIVLSAGIDFGTSTDGTGTVTGGVLDDYEEGTWTIDDSSSAVLVSNEIGRYIKIGNQVTVYGSFDMPSTSDVNVWTAGGLPFSRAENTSNVSAIGGVMNATGGFNGCVGFYSISETTFLFFGNNDSVLSGVNLSSKTVRFTMTYRTA